MKQNQRNDVFGIRLALDLTAMVAGFTYLLTLGAQSATPTPPPQTLPVFDFTDSTLARQWGNPHHISSLKPVEEGLEMQIAGPDPYFYGPARDYPADTPLWAVVRLKSDVGGTAQIFYFRDHADPGHVASFRVTKDRWTETRVSLPPMGAGFRLRIDPPGTDGTCILSRLAFEPRVELTIPKWPAPPLLQTEARAALTADRLTWHANPKLPWAFELRVDGQSLAFGYPFPRVAYVAQGQPIWMDVPPPQLTPRGKGVELSSRRRDAQGADWTFHHLFKADAENTIAVETRVMVSQNREVLFLPLLLLTPGVQSFGTNKNQALLAGLEYLENEPGSSEADIIGPQARRQVPANHKITFPLMAVQARKKYVGLTWEDHLKYSALFDSPDRVLQSGGHLMGILWPGSDGLNRVEGALTPVAPEVLVANQPLVLRARLLAGHGETVVAAVQHYVKLQGWPATPRTGLELPQYVSLASQGWLSSKIREGNRYRHAFWPGFDEGPAADAAVFETWLATHAEAGLAGQLKEAAAGALSLVPANQYYHSGVGHVRTPAACLVYNQVLPNLETARTAARINLQRLGTKGVITCHPATGRPDYARTYWTNHANGTTARVVFDALEAAAFSGNTTLVTQAVAALSAMAQYHHGVPRGAQTWEIPLHTPDILAAAHLVHAYVLGYELTGDPQWLAEARYWAWTGVPFVYLTPPVEEPVGLYSTIAVLGATSWKAPIWFGQPVQWCGMGYADALFRLAAVDGAGPWRQLAEGITSAALQHTWKANDRERGGLLPDYYLLREQLSEGPAINPATAGIGAVRLLGGTPLYEFRAARATGLWIHAPGGIEIISETPREATLQVRGWPREEYSVLIHGVKPSARVLMNGRETATTAPHDYVAESRSLVLRTKGTTKIEVRQ